MDTQTAICTLTRQEIFGTWAFMGRYTEHGLPQMGQSIPLVLTNGMLFHPRSMAL